MRLLVAALFITVAVAGCLSGTETNGQPPMATLVCDPACNMQSTIDPVERQANELSIAVNPTNPLNIVASGKDYNPAEAGDCVRDGVYVTLDGGQTWVNSNVPQSPWRLMDDPTAFEPGELSMYWCVTDPVLAFGPDGTLYWTIMPYQCDAISGSKTGRGVHPDGGFNDWFWTCSAMYVLASDDGGLTWPRVREVAFGPRLEHDKQWMSVAPDGTVLLCWDRDPSYQATSLVPGGNAASQLAPGGLMSCATSKDKGDTWSEVTDVNTDWEGFLPWVDWTGDNVAWMAAIRGEFIGGGEVIVSKSADGLVWDEPVAVGEYVNPPTGGEYGWPVLNGSDFRIFTLPTIAIDRTTGPYGGSIDVAWFDHSGDNGEVLLTYSRDGETWSDVTRIGSPEAESHDQFMPAISVGPDGTVDLVWYDTQADPNQHLFDLYYSYSINGGETWAPELRVSEVSVDEQYSHHQNGMIFMGDYIDIDSTEGHAYPVWVDTRNEKADAFVAKIARPGVEA